MLSQKKLYAWILDYFKMFYIYCVLSKLKLCRKAIAHIVGDNLQNYGTTHYIYETRRDNKPYLIMKIFSPKNVQPL